MKTKLSKYIIKCIRCLLPLPGLFFIFCSAVLATQIIVDNRDSNTVALGDWWVNDSHIQNWGPDSFVAASDKSNFVWLPDIPEAGDYAVYARWTRNSKRPSNVKYFINSSGTVYVVTVNQEDPAQGGQWNLLGTFPLDAGTARIRVRGKNGLVSADAVYLVKKDAVPQQGFTTVGESAWDDIAVRKVLHTFAYGGRARDSQIQAWADMSPENAISEILTFDQHNLLLAPVRSSQGDYDRLHKVEGTLRGLSDFWSSNALENGVPASRRWHYGIDQNSKYQIQNAWIKAATSGGLNSFRQKIGLWETNYHMATSLGTLGYLNKHMMVRYYDDIMNAHEQGQPYQDVIATAGLSAAVARQYGHFENIYINGECRCNEDFAREFHQLFFGVLGNHDPEYHETVTIKNTARALTDMPFALLPNSTKPGDELIFGTSMHYPDPLEILDVTVGGSDARQRLVELSLYAINHPESLDNLPVKVISGLADDQLTDEKIQKIRAAWAAMPQKNLLDFLRSYAISEMFHSEDRVKYLSSIDRFMLLGNKVMLNNEEGYLRLYDLKGFAKEDSVTFFPEHLVFGGQTGIEASNSVDVFRKNYNRNVSTPWRYARASGTEFGRVWEKDWSSVIQANAQGNYVVKDVAEWLWDRFIGDGLKNMGELERGHLYALLGSGLDIGYLADPGRPQRVITTQDITTEPELVELLDDMATRLLVLSSPDSAEREEANQRVGQAINFIATTPFIFAQEGR